MMGATSCVDWCLIRGRPSAAELGLRFMHDMRSDGPMVQDLCAGTKRKVSYDVDQSGQANSYSFDLGSS